MTIKRIRKWIITLGMISSLSILLTIRGLSQTPQPEEKGTLFVGEDCISHCWFELLTSDSTSEEVYNWLLTSENVCREPLCSPVEEMISGEFIPETNIVVDGQYDFLLLPDPIRTYYDTNYTRLLILMITSSIKIEDGFITESFIDIWDWIHISDVLEVLGQPDLIRFDYDDFATIATLQFIYIERRLRMTFQHFRPDIQPSSEFNCNISNFLNMSWLSSMTYYSLENSLEIVSNLQGEVAPRLVIDYGSSYDIPFDVWETWLMMDDTFSCREAYEMLPTERIYPDLSILEATPEPSP